MSNYGVHRRGLLKAGVLGAATLVGAASGAGRLWAQPARRTETLTLRAPAEPIGMYVYLPFEVPPGVSRVEGVTVERAGATTGLGLFDNRGPQYGSDGFRGLYGGELAAFSVAPDTASRSFIPGPIEPGEWTVIVPMFSNPSSGGEIVVEVTLFFGPMPQVFRPGAAPGVVRDEPGWYRGDLHCHTPQSSDAWNSGSAMTPRQWAEECRRVGLDFAAMTDHNVVSQNFALVEDAGPDVLLLGGEEMTNFFHGHATVTGLEPGEWLDWRQRPAQVPLQENEARIIEFIRTAREMGTYTSAAHPNAPLPGLPWQFFADAAENPGDPDWFPDGIEVWTGDFQPDDESALDKWDQMLLSGRRVPANGGSDLHGVVNELQPGYAGGPTTVVYAEQLGPDALVAALRAGRSFITRAPNGAELYLTATGPDDQETFTGGTIHGGPTDTVEVQVLVRRGALLGEGSNSLRLILLRDGQEFSVTPITQGQQTVRATMPIGVGGYVRAELRGEPFISDSPTGSRLDMEAFTNPIWLSTEPRPDDLGPETAPPPQPTTDRLDRHQRLTGRATAAGAVAAVGFGRMPPARALDPGTANRVTLGSLRWRAALGGGLQGAPLRVVGQLTARQDGDATLTRWVTDCCASDGRAVEVALRRLPEEPVVGEWLEVDAEWVTGTGVGFADLPVLDVSSARVLAKRPGRFEA